jgi:transcription factor TGA
MLATCMLLLEPFRPPPPQVVVRHVEPLAEQQAAGARDVEQAARRTEEALDAELEALLRSLSEVVSSDVQPPGPGMMYGGGGQLYHPADVAGYMGMGHMHVALAMDKVASLGTILRQVRTCMHASSVRPSIFSLPSRFIIVRNFQPS